MKLRGLIASLVCLTISAVSPLSGNLCFAQMVPQPPFVVPYTPGMTSGLFYFNAGIKYRNIQTSTFEVTGRTVTQIRELGAVPFGPETPGTVFYPFDPLAGLPTGLPGTDPDTSGIWSYDDGLIDPRSPGLNPGDTQYGVVPSALALGYYNLSQTNVGFFIVSTPSAQTNSPSLYSDSTYVLLSRRIDGREAPFETASRIFQFSTPVARNYEFTNKIWTPYFEVGYRPSSFFDLLFGVSWFNISNTSTTRATSQAFIARRTFQDSFTFSSSDNTQGWSTPFNSAITAGGGSVNPVDTEAYVIYPAGLATGRNRPTRTFAQEIDPSVPPIPAEETIFNRVDFTAIEFKSGGRSWFPLYGAGEIGTSLGVLFTPMPVQIVNSQRVVALAASPAMGVVAGDILIDIANKHEEIWMWKNIGLFAGADLRFNFGRFFFQSNVEYDFYPMTNQYGDILINAVNISGFNANFTAGTSF